MAGKRKSTGRRVSFSQPSLSAHRGHGARRLRLEALEDRRLLDSAGLVDRDADADPDDTFAEALHFGPITLPAVVSDAIDSRTDVDMYGFEVTAGQKLAFDIDTAENGVPGLGSYLRVFAANGRELAANNDRQAPDEPQPPAGETHYERFFDSYIEYTFSTAGVYYVGVSNWQHYSYNPQTGQNAVGSDTRHLTGSYTLIVSSLSAPPTNTPPVAQPLTLTTDEDTAATVTLEASDADGDPLSFAIVAQPQYGTLSNVAGALVYTPAPNYFGPDSFSYQAHDGKAPSNVATVAITVREVNDPPVPGADSALVDEDGQVVIDVLANDVPGPANESGQALGIAAAWATLGTVAINADGTLTYTPPANYFGPDTIGYTVVDNGTTAGADDPQAAIGAVAVGVVEVNDAPVALDDSARVIDGGSVKIHVLANDFDPDTLDGLPGNDDSLWVELVAPPAWGDVQLNADGSFTYNHHAGDPLPVSFTYRAVDSDGAASAPATVTISAAAVLEEGQIDFDASIVRINGTSLDDTILIEPVEGALRVTLNGQVLTERLPPIAVADLAEIRAWGRAGNDTILVRGLAVPTVLEGNEGDDWIEGGDGRDLLYGGTGNDTLWGGLGRDRMYGQLGNDTLHGGDDRDTISGQGGHDWIDGEGGNDLLYGNGGHDRLRGNEGNDRLYGHDGDDVLLGNSGKDRVIGAWGRDILIAGAEADAVLGHSDEDLVIGGATLYDDDDEALDGLLLAWLDGAPLGERITRITATGFGWQYQYRLIAGDTVLADWAIDDLAGNGQADWLFAERDIDLIHATAVDVVTHVN